MTAFIFVPLLAFTMAYTALLIVYSAHVFLVVVEDTAAGNDEVTWPSDPLYDWAWKGIYLTWLAGVWLIPALLVARMFSPLFPEEVRGAWFVGLTALAFWVAFPISLLSSMSAESSFAVLHGGLFARLARRGGSVLAFYLLSGIVVLIGAPLVYGLVLSEWMAAPFVAAVGLGIGWLLYARLLGRLALLARLTPLKRRKSGKVKRPKGTKVSDPWAVPDEARDRDAARAAVRMQPSEMAPLHTPFEGEVTGYDVRFDDDPPPPAPKLRRPQPEPEEAIEMVEEEPVATEPRRPLQVEPDKVEMDRIRRREQERKLPRAPWVEGVWTFPFYSNSLITVTVLALGFGLWGGCFRMLVMFWPF